MLVVFPGHKSALLGGNLPMKVLMFSGLETRTPICRRAAALCAPHHRLSLLTLHAGMLMANGARTRLLLLLLLLLGSSRCCRSVVGRKC